MTRIKKKKIRRKRTGGFGEVWLKAITKKVPKTGIGGSPALKQNQNTMENDDIEGMIEQAKSKRRQNLFDQRVALLKAEDAFKQLGGEDNYELSLSAIVTAYPNGITLTRVRELLPDSKELDAAKESLKSKGLIDVGTDKRSPLLKPLKSANTKADDEETVPPAASTKKPTPKSAKTTEEDTES